MQASFRRADSLRWQTRKVLRDNTVRPRRRLRSVVDATTTLAGKPWALPILAAGVGAALQLYDLRWSPLAIFYRVEGRTFLSTLWEVEAAAVALVLAGALFAFESLGRQRGDLPLSEYADRSGLSQFFMWAVSGLVAIPVVLVWTPGIPAPSASLVAAIVGTTGLGVLPFFFYRAMQVVNPGWLQDARLNQLRGRMKAAVETDATARVSAGILNEWAREHDMDVGYRIGLPEDRTVEVSSGQGTTLDIDLGSAARLAQAYPGRLTIFTHIGEPLWGGAGLVGVDEVSDLRYAGPLVTTSNLTIEDPLLPLIQELHSEAIDAIEHGAVRAAEAVADLYAELWLAWPREWATYGQQLKGGLLDSPEPFRLGPTLELKRHLRRQLDRAIERGLEDHVAATTGILWKVGLESVRLGAVDLVQEMNQLARSFLTVRSAQYPDLADRSVEDAWRFQIGMCDYVTRDIDDVSFLEQPDDKRDVTVTLTLTCFRAIVESLKVLLDIGRYEELKSLDGRFLDVLRYSPLEDRRFLDEMIIDDPQSTDEAVSHARARLSAADSLADLRVFRAASRLSLLGWGLCSPAALVNSELLDRLRNLAQTIGSVDDVMAAASEALDYRRTFMSDWVSFALPEGEAHSIDADGPVLTAVAISLLAKPNISEIPGSEWMTHERIERLTSIINEAAGWEQLWGREGETEQDVRERAEELKEKLGNAEGEQRNQEKLNLIAQPLDMTKVETFGDALKRAWSDNRVLPEFAQLALIPGSQTPETGWGEDRFRFPPRLDPKGLFVTPTNWVGLENTAQDLGRHLARDEVGSIVRLAVLHGTESSAVGEVAAKVQALLDQARADGLHPTVVLIPVHWRLVDALGLRNELPNVRSGHLGHSFKGHFDGVPVLQWRDVPDDRVYVIDGQRFCQVVEGVEANGEPSPPAVAIRTIDEDRARQIVANWDPVEDEAERLLEVQTKVERDVSRPYRVEERDTDAVRYITFDEPQKNPEAAAAPEEPLNSP
ncbi:MAG: hypothetical protein Q8Q52_04020 [Acidimicrobiia bacterium]|nr:hypothetical protein [Acidimicrobiia bacterium]